MHKYWPLLVMISTIILIVPAFAQGDVVPACTVQAVGGTFSNDLIVSGKVGIGLAAGVVPASKLDVSGNAIVSGDINAGGTITGTQYCIGNSCIQAWPAGGGQADGTGGWAEGADATSTNKKAVITNDLEVVGKVKAAGFVATGLASCAGKLYTDANGNLVCGEDQTGAAANAVTGQGAANTLTKWTGANQIGNSVIFENGGQIGIGTATPSEKLEVAGKIKATIIKGNSFCFIDDAGAEDCKQAWPAGGGGGEIDWSAITNIPAGFADNNDAVGIVAETDPKVGTLAANKWCKSDGNKIICQDDLPALNELDPTVPDDIKQGIINWANIQGVPADLSNGDQVGILEESDPKVGAIVDGKWCKAANGQVVCQDNLPALDEADPLFSAWDKSAGITITEGQISDLQAYLTAETDPTIPDGLKDGVGWGEIAGIPEGFADETDDTGIIVEADPTVPADIKQGIVDWANIQGMPAGFADSTDDGIAVESDPEFANWDRSEGITINEKQISDLKPYLTEEEDPYINRINSKDGKVCTYDTATQTVKCDSDLPVLDEQDPTINKAGSLNSKLCTYNEATQTVTCTSDFLAEEDPVFSNWDRKITESQITDLQPYLLEESDPAINKIISVDGKICTYNSNTQTVTCTSDFPTIDWTELTGVPDGFVDGIDNGITIESDPEFNNWDKSEGITISENQISDLQSYITAEQDPTVPADVKDGVDWAELTGVPADIVTGTGIDDNLLKWIDGKATSSSIIETAKGVGINTAAPNAALDVGGNIKSSSKIFSTYQDAKNPSIIVGFGSAGIGTPDSDALDFWSSSGVFNFKALDADANVLNYLTISGGNVGIGTDAPENYKLEVAGNAKFDSIDTDKIATLGDMAIGGKVLAGAGLDIVGNAYLSSDTGFSKLGINTDPATWATTPNAVLGIFKASGGNDPVAFFGGPGANSLAVRGGALGTDSISLFVSGGSDNFIPSTSTGDAGIRYGKKLFFGGSDWDAQINAGKVIAKSGLCIGTSTNCLSNTATLVTFSAQSSNTIPTWSTVSGTLVNSIITQKTAGNTINVGIGNPNPAERLDVSGNIKASGKVITTRTEVTSNIDAGYSFEDRSAGDRWELYSKANNAYFYYSKGTANVGYTDGNKITITPDGELFSNGILLKSQSGSCYVIIVQNTGGLGTESAPCPA